MTSCDYCGRETQPRDAFNCCGCGAPLRLFRARILCTSETLTPDQVRRLRGDVDERFGNPYIPQARPIKKP